MTETLRYIKTRITSIENIIKTTKAMEVVSMAKLRALQANINILKSYHAHLLAMVRDLVSHCEGLTHPFLAKRDIKARALCVFTSDTGLCGPYNHDMIKVAERFIAENTDRPLECFLIGKKGVSYFRERGMKISDAYTDLHGTYSAQISDKVASSLASMFMSGKADEICVAYTQFNTGADRKPRIEKFLPVMIAPEQGYERLITEPSCGEILEKILPYFVGNRMRNIMFDALASEHFSRVIAMKEASDNAGDMRDELVLRRNKVRQANITKELIEVISSADALKG